jgi:predicted ATP-grasp superfamily ATP-dependent carboligase
LELSVTQRDAFERLGNALTAAFSLRGLFGVDCVLNMHDHDLPYPVEINPRYTASIEVLELAKRIPFVEAHRCVFDASASGSSRRGVRPMGAIGKAILYAKESMVFPREGLWRSALEQPADLWEVPVFADIPKAGQRIAAGRPVLTFFTRARAPAPAHCEYELEQIAAGLDRLLFPH